MKYEIFFDDNIVSFAVSGNVFEYTGNTFDVSEPSAISITPPAPKFSDAAGKNDGED